MTLTPEQTKAMLDSLFALPDKVAKPKAKAPAKAASAPATPRPRSPRTTLGLTSAGYLPAMKLQTIMHQHCTCCNSDTEYILPAVIRFEGRKAAAIEIPASVEMHLPVSVKEDWQTVQQCPKCIRMSRNIEDTIQGLLDIPSPARQLELFQ